MISVFYALVFLSSISRDIVSISMPNRNLRDLHSSVRDSVLDSIQVVKEVERYRNYWKPDRITTLLLAESHVHTSDDDFDHMWRYKNLDGHFVRFVYCLGYGENDLFRKGAFRKSPNNNDQGTRPFWEIFYSCLHKVKSNDDFEQLRKAKTAWNSRVEAKIELLKNLRKQGIWLADASPIAIDMLKIEAKIEIMQKAWNSYTGKLVEQLADNSVKRICIIGKTVDKAIGNNVRRLGLRVELIEQPNFHTAEERWESFAEYYRLCH